MHLTERPPSLADWRALPQPASRKQQARHRPQVISSNLRSTSYKQQEASRRHHCWQEQVQAQAFSALQGPWVPALNKAGVDSGATAGALQSLLMSVFQRSQHPGLAHLSLLNCSITVTLSSRSHYRRGSFACKETHSSMQKLITLLAQQQVVAVCSDLLQ